MTNAKLRDFTDLINDNIDLNVPTSILETACQWVASNMNPDEIFKDDELRAYIAKSSLPEDVFEENKLQEWAEANGYVKE